VFLQSSTRRVLSVQWSIEQLLFKNAQILTCTRERKVPTVNSQAHWHRGQTSSPERRTSGFQENTTNSF
jgi:hypothetical protein